MCLFCGKQGGPPWGWVASTAAHLGSLAGIGRSCHSLERFSSGLLERAFSLRCWNPRAAPSPSRDMDVIRCMKHPDLFLSLKRDLAMVVIQHIFEFKCWVKLSLFLSLIFFFFNNGIPLSFLYKSPNKFLWPMNGFGTPVMRLGLRPTPVLRLRSPWEPSSKSKWSWPTSWPLWRGHIWVPKPFWRVQRPRSRTSASSFIWLR